MTRQNTATVSVGADPIRRLSTEYPDQINAQSPAAAYPGTCSAENSAPGPATTSAAPTNATTAPATCPARSRSPGKNPENSTISNGQRYAISPACAGGASRSAVK